MGFFLESEKLIRIIKQISEKLDEKQKIKDQLLPIIKEGVALASLTIHSLHINDFDSADHNLEKLEHLLDEVKKNTHQYPDLYYGNFLLTLFQEYSEAKLFYQIVRDKKISTPEELDVPYAAYLLGLADLIGELRRKILSLIRNNEIDAAMNLGDVILEIYDAINMIKVSDSIAPGFRHKKDVARSLVDRTQSDLLNALLVSKLEKTRKDV